MKNENGTEKGNTKILRPYEKPELVLFGALSHLTRTNTSGANMDGGVSPNDRTPQAEMSMCIGTVSALEEHRHLLQDFYAQNLFREAIQAVVRPGDVVLDLGCGSGIHSFFACEAGAKKVYAVDVDTVLELAQEAGAKNPHGERIQWIYAHSEELELPEQVDVIITNIGFLASLQYLPRAAERFLKKGGRLIPGRLELGFVPLSGSQVLDEQVFIWEKDIFGQEFTNFQKYAVNRPWYDHMLEESYLSRPQVCATWDLSKVPEAEDRWSLEFTMKEPGQLSALGGFYSFHLADGITMSTKPPMHISKKIWHNPILPLEKPISVTQGEHVFVDIACHRSVDPFDPIWIWKVRTERESREQNSFLGTPLSKTLLKKLQHVHEDVPINLAAATVLAGQRIGA